MEQKRKIEVFSAGCPACNVPAVAINGKLAGCCTGRGVDAETLRREGVEVAL